MGDRMTNREATSLVNAFIGELRTHTTFNDWWKKLVSTDNDRDLVDRLVEIVLIEE